MDALQDEPARIHAVQADHPDGGFGSRVTVGVEEDERIDAIAAEPDLSGSRERTGADEGPVLAAGDRVVRIHLADVDLVSLRRIEVVDDVDGTGDEPAFRRR